VEPDLQGFLLLLVLLPPQRTDLNTCRIERGVDMVVILLEMGMGVVVELAVMVAAELAVMVVAIPVAMEKVVIMAMDEIIVTETEIVVALLV